MKQNDFRELVDRELADLQWDEAKSRRVLDALEPAAIPVLPVRRKMSLALALAVILTLLTATALAVALIRYSPRVNLESRARQLLMAQYGLTRETMGLFSSKVTEEAGETVVIFEPTQWDNDFTGVYTVRFAGGEAAASWTYDDMDPALYQGGDFAAPIWGPDQLAAYLAEGPIHEASSPYRRNRSRDSSAPRGAADKLPDPDPDLDAAFWNGERWVAQHWDGQRWIYDDEWVEGLLTYRQAEDIARAALAETFDFTAATAAQIDFFDAILCVLGDDGHYTWQIRGFLYLDNVDLCMYVYIDAATGEVERIGLETGGNG